ncbi:hypothetical protein LTR95_017394, partial [Oleoguttula sp. CCFEE 5521]
ALSKASRALEIPDASKEGILLHHHRVDHLPDSRYRLQGRQPCLDRFTGDTTDKI